MNRYLLDTNIVSELRKPRPHGAVLAWLNRLRDEQLFLSAVTLGELQVGVERIRKEDAAKAEQLEAWIDLLAGSYQVLAMDAPCFRDWGRLVYAKPDHFLEDAMIAATARVHGLIVATRNERHFRHLEVRVVNPFNTEIRPL
jgi:toxin FitB